MRKVRFQLDIHGCCIYNCCCHLHIHFANNEKCIDAVLKNVKKTLSEDITRGLNQIIEVCDKYNVLEHAKLSALDEQNQLVAT